MSLEYYSTNNYIYISHLDSKGHYWELPVAPDKISDSMTSTFAETQALGRSAPVFTYSHSGPRKVQLELFLRRDMMDDINVFNTSADVESGEDFIDSLIRGLQAIAVPKYDISNKAVEPPLVTMRLSNEVFIKGVVSSNIGVEYGLPIISGGRYAQVRISFEVTEVDPYDSTAVFKNGSFRGVTQLMKELFGMN